MKSFYGLSVCVAAALAIACAQPAHAGSWVLTSAYTGSGNAGSWGSNWVNYNTSTTYSFGAVFDNGSGGETGSWTYTGQIKWVGTGTQPSTVTLNETGGATADALYTSTATESVNDGFGDPTTTQVLNNPYPNVQSTSTGSHTTVVSVAPGATYTFHRTLSASCFGGALNDCNVQYSISIQ